MIPEYNSKLISKLYSETDEEKIIEILDDIEEIKDPIFIYPLLDAYNKFKDSVISHFFLSSLKQIESAEVQKIALNLLVSPYYDKTNFSWLLQILDKHKYYDERIVELAKEFVSDYNDDELRNKKWEYSDYHQLNTALTYLLNSGKLKDVLSFLWVIFLDQDRNRESKNIVLKFLFKEETKESIDYLISNYTDIKDTANEIILSRFLVGWTGPKISELKKIIIANGQPRAKEILIEEQKKKDKEEKKVQQDTAEKESIIYNNAKIISEIIRLRQSINIKAQANPNINLKLFPESELLIEQIEIADDESKLRDCCIDLRTIIQLVNDETKNHGLSFEQICELIPGVNQLSANKSINQLFVFLKTKGIKLTQDFFGLRNLNDLVNLFGSHPNDQERLLKSLGDNGLLKLFTDKDWPSIHKKILSLYNKFLITLDNSLNMPS